MGVAQGFPWEVLSGSPEFDGLSALRLTTEVTKARLRQFQSMMPQPRPRQMRLL